MLTVNCSKLPSGGVIVHKQNGELLALFPKFLSNKPDYHNKSVMINCNRYKIIWIK